MNAARAGRTVSTLLLSGALVGLGGGCVDRTRTWEAPESASPGAAAWVPAPVATATARRPAHGVTRADRLQPAEILLAVRPREPAAPAEAAPPEPDTTIAAIRAALPAAIEAVPLPRVVQGIYDRRGGGPLFFQGLAPGAEAARVLALVEDLPSHALDPEPYGLDAAVASPAPSPVEAARRDARLTSAVARYVLDFRLLVRAHPTDPTRDVPALIQARQSEIADLAARTFPGVSDGLRGLWPIRPEYEVIRQALPEWRERAKTSRKMPTVPMRYRTIEPGERSKTVTAVQERLRFDGTYEGELTGVLDEPTMEAVRRFQARNGLVVDGKPGRDTIKMLNVRPADRLDQLKASLHRLRESKPHRLGLRTYLRVNLPGYHLELFEDGRRTRRQRVIVGNTDLDHNRKEWLQGYLNRTPLLETRLFKIIVNPVWIVPPRIRDGELRPAQEKDGSYFRRHGYRVSSHAGKEIVVQSSGSHNALGRVKFLLERTNAVYLHDTNKRHLFDRPYRALSHGCMRVDQAVDLATYLLTSRVGLAPEEVEAMFDSRTTRAIDVPEPIEVYVEYVSAGVDDEGELVLHEDIYGYDAAFARGKVPVRQDIRYGAGILRPRDVPRIPYEKYRELRPQGGLAPEAWPPQAEPEPTGG